MQKSIIAILSILITSSSFAYNFTIKGKITETRFGLAVPNQTIYFYKNQTQRPEEAITNADGEYSISFTFAKGESIPILINTLSKCDIDYTRTVYSFSGKSKVNFEICLSDKDYKCNPAFEYTVDNQRNIELKSNSKKYVSAYSWDLGNGAYLSGKEVSHHYRVDGNYQVCSIIRGLYGCQAKLCKQVTVKGTQKIGGKIYLKNTPMPSGTVYLYKKDRAKFSTPIITDAKDGNYNYEDIASGEYIFYAIYEFDYEHFYFPNLSPPIVEAEFFGKMRLITM